MLKIKLKIKKDDDVQMLAGKDKGKRGKVLKVIKSKRRITIDGLNLIKKHKKPTKQGEKGEIISLPRAVDISNVALYCSKCNKPSKVGYHLLDDKKIRICKKCQQEI